MARWRVGFSLRKEVEIEVEADDGYEAVDEATEELDTHGFVDFDVDFVEQVEG